jgi:hypothetical protein
MTSRLLYTILSALLGTASMNAAARELIKIDGFDSGARVVLTGPAIANPGETIELEWLSTGFNGTVACQARQILGAPVTGLGGLQAGIDSTFVQVASGPAESLRFGVTCSDGQVQASSEFSINRVSGCVGTAIYNGVPLLPGTQAPVNFAPGVLVTSGLISGAYNSYTFKLNAASAPVFDIVGFVSTASAPGIAAISVSECQGDYRSAQLINDAVSKRCLVTSSNGGGVINIASGVTPPFATPTCPVVIGRDYFVNFTFGTAASPIGGPAFCSDFKGCIYRFEVLQP